MGPRHSADPDQTPHNAVSDQDLPCLLTECSIKICEEKRKTSTKHPLNLILARPADKGRLVHSALMGYYQNFSFTGWLEKYTNICIIM